MGKIKRGILGGISGIVGNVVGSSWKGIDYIKTQPKHIKNPRSQAQQNQRERFSLSLQTISPMLQFINKVYKGYSPYKTAYNSAMAHCMSNAIAGEFPEYTIDFSKVLVSSGSLAQPIPQAAWADRGTVTFFWLDNSTTDSSDANDVACVLVFDKDSSEVFCNTFGTGRRGGPCSETISIPSRSISHKLECYLAFISADKRNSSNSVYCGEVVAQ